MKTYIRLSDKKYPMRVAQIRNELKASGTLLPSEPTDELLLSLGFALVVETPRPIGDVVTEAEPVEVEGVWTQQWDVREFTEDEKRQRFEERRNQLLDELEQRFQARAEQGVEYEFTPGVVEHVQVRGEHKANLIGLCLDAVIARIDDLDVKSEPEEPNPVPEGEEEGVVPVQADDPVTHYPIPFKTYENNFHMLNADQVIHMARSVLKGYYEITNQYWSAKNELTEAQFGSELPELPF